MLLRKPKIKRKPLYDDSLAIKWSLGFQQLVFDLISDRIGFPTLVTS